MAAPFITLDNITIRLFDKLLFKRSRWAIRSDEHWAVIGPNGSGKSTLVRAVCGEAPVVSGEIIYHFADDVSTGEHLSYDELPGNQIAHVSFGDQKNLICCHSEYHQARWHSGETESAPRAADLLSIESIEGVSPFEVRVPKKTDAAFLRHRREAIRLLGIGHLLDRKVTCLSNGELRKTLLARALAQSPRLLILDDPFSGLDTPSRTAFRRIIGSLMKRDMRVVVITPRIEEIPPGITHVLFVKDFRIVSQGDRETVLKSRTIRRFFRPESRVARPPIPHRRAVARRPVAVRQPLIEIRNGSVAYGGVRILTGIDWTMREGENWALLGPNGAGKSTLLSLILGDNPQAYANDIALFGRQRQSGESIWDIKRNIGWVSPEIQIHYQEGITAYQVICSGFFDTIGLYRRCSSSQRHAARRWIGRMGIAGLAAKPFDELSDGQQRMVLLARALVKGPRLLVLDEPCQGLDPAHRRAVLELVDRIGFRTGAGLIYVTHHADEIPRSITHVLRLRKGRITQKGKRRERPAR